MSDWSMPVGELEEGIAAELAQDSARRRPPHFPDPDANAIALLEAHNGELVEALADAHKEAKAWQAQLETALMRLGSLERLVKNGSLVVAPGLFDAEPTSSNLGHG